VWPFSSFSTIFHRCYSALSLASEYLYNRNKNQPAFSISDFVHEEQPEPEDNDDTALVKEALEHIRRLLEGSPMPPEDELIKIIRSVNYDASEAMEIIFSKNPGAVKGLLSAHTLL